MTPGWMHTIDFNRPRISPGGGSVTSFVVGEDDQWGKVGWAPGPTYADVRAQYWAWNNLDLDIVGFQGYRKHFNFRDDRDWTSRSAESGAPGVPIAEFLEYQEWLRNWDGIEARMAGYDILVTPRFHLADNDTVDYCRTRCAADWCSLIEVMCKHGDFNYRLQDLHQNLYVARKCAFYQYMRFWNKIVRELEPMVNTTNAPDWYKVRPMAVLSERIFNIWLHSSGLKVGIVPLIICWETGGERPYQ